MPKSIIKGLLVSFKIVAYCKGKNYHSLESFVQQTKGGYKVIDSPVLTTQHRREEAEMLKK